MFEKRLCLSNGLIGLIYWGCLLIQEHYRYFSNKAFSQVYIIIQCCMKTEHIHRECVLGGGGWTTNSNSHTCYC